MSGTILQIVSGTDQTQRLSTSTTFVTNSNTVSATITPASASNKILVLLSGSGFHADGNAEAYYTIYRGSTNLGTANGIVQLRNDASNGGAGISMCFVDSPATTSATTYQLYGRSNIGGYNHYLNAANTLTTITVLEIKA